MGKDSKTTASSEEAVETTTNEVVAENVETASDEVVETEKAESVAEEKPKTAPKSKKSLKVKFLLSPTGRFGLAYSEGETGTFPENEANELVEAKYAEFVK